MSWRDRFVQTAFTGGELSSRLRARVDLARHQSGADTILNGVVHPAGGVEQRSGTIWAADPKILDAPGRTLAFVRAAGDAVAVLVQRSVLRFVDVASRAYVLAAGSPYEIACPWTDADLAHLQTWQSGDVLYIADRRGTAPVRCLIRRGAADWVLETLECREGPWLPEEDGATLSASATTGVVTLTVSAARFRAGHAGALVRVRENAGAPPVRRWEAGASVTAGERRFNNGRVYAAQGNGTTGNNSPIHDAGDVSDGGVTWRFVHDGAGVVRIDMVNSPTSATGTVLITLPALSSEYWAFGAFSADAGYPPAGVIHHERFCLAGASSAPDTFHGGQVGGYGPTFANFKPGLGSGLVVDSDAVARTLANGRVEPIGHLVSAERLLAFTTGGVHTISGPSVDEPLAPADAAARERLAIGCAPSVSPVKVADTVLFVQLGRRALRELAPDARGAANLAVAADHIGRRRFAQLAATMSPLPLIWTRLDDGGLASLTYERDEQVVAWSRHAIGAGGVVEDIAAFPRLDGEDEVWLWVRRRIAGVERRSIEVLPPPWDRLVDPLERAVCVDAAGFFDAWNADPARRARIVVLDDAERTVRIESDFDLFEGDDLGRTFAFRLQEPGPGRGPAGVVGEAAAARVLVDVIAGPRAATGRLVADGPEALAGTWTSLWARMVTTLTGLARLEGESVDVLADGQAHQGLVVTAGAVTLPEPAARAWCGPPFGVEIKDLPIGAGLAGRPKRVERAYVVTETASPGLVVVSERHADPLAFRLADQAVADVPLVTDETLVAIVGSGWNVRGQVHLRNTAPFPCEILGIVKEVAA